MREAFWFCVKVVTVILVVLCVISLPFSGQIIALFRRDDPQVIEIGTFALRLQLLTLPLWGYITMCNMFTQAIGYGVRSTIISTARQGIFLIPALLIFPRILRSARHPDQPARRGYLHAGAVHRHDERDSAPAQSPRSERGLSPILC